MLNLNVPPQKLFGWFRKPQLWATGDWQLHHNNVPTHSSHLLQSFLVKHQITQVTQAPYSPDLAPCDFYLFPKLKWPLEGKRFQITDEVQKNRMGQLMVIGRTVWGPMVSTWKGTEASLSCVQCSLYLLISSINVYFSYCTAGYFMDRPHLYFQYTGVWGRNTSPASHSTTVGNSSS